MSDFYYLTMPSQARVQVLLEDIPAKKDYDLYIWYWNGTEYAVLARSAQYDSSNEVIRFWPTPGVTYWVQVHAYQGPQPPPPPDNYSQEPYSLTVSIIG